MTLVTPKPGQFLYYKGDTVLAFASFRSGAKGLTMSTQVRLSEEETERALAEALGENLEIRQLLPTEEHLLEIVSRIPKLPTSDSEVTISVGRLRPWADNVNIQAIAKPKQVEIGRSKVLMAYPTYHSKFATLSFESPENFSFDQVEFGFMGGKVVHSSIVESARPAKRPLKDAGKQKKESSPGFLGWLGNLFKDEKKEESKQKIQRYLKKNYSRLAGLEQQIKENDGLAEFLLESVEKGELTAPSLATLSELIQRDEGWVDKLNLTGKGTDTPELTVKLSDLDEYADSTSTDYKASVEALEATLKRLIGAHTQSDIGNLKFDIDPLTADAGDRIISISGPIKDLLIIIKEFKIQPDELLHDL